MKLRPTSLALLIGLALSGCTTHSDKKGTDRYTAVMLNDTREQVSKKRGDLTLDAKRAAQMVNRPYIAGKPRPLSRDVMLPPALQGTVDTVMLFPRDEASLLTLADRIQDATGIIVKVTPDALLPLTAFQPRLSKTDDLGQVVSPQTVNLDSPIALDSPLPPGGIGSGPSREPTPTIPLSHKPLKAAGRKPLPYVLDAIALRLGVYWRFDDQLNAIVFYRTETRTFEVRNAELEGHSKISAGLTGQMDQSNSGSSGLKSESNSSMNTPEDKGGVMGVIARRVEQFMTVSGQLSAGSGGLLVVTDTKSALDAIGEYLEHENRMRSRRIEFALEEITVEHTQSSQAGVNWNLQYNSGGRGNAFSVNGLNSLLEQEGAAMTVGAGIGYGPWKGSSVAVQALSKLGKVVDRKVNTFGSNNGQPATTGRPERQTYIAKLQQTQNYSQYSAPTVSVTQEEVVSGRILTVVPYAYSNGDINLAIKYDNTPSPIISKQTLPDGSYVQSPHTVGDVLVRTVTVKSGQPFVINAYTADTTQYNERRVDRKASLLFGGSDVADQNNRVTVLVLTAMVRE